MSYFQTNMVSEILYWDNQMSFSHVCVTYEFKTPLFAVQNIRMNSENKPKTVLHFLLNFLWNTMHYPWKYTLTISASDSFSLYNHSVFVPKQNSERLIFFCLFSHELRTWGLWFYFNCLIRYKICIPRQASGY